MLSRRWLAALLFCASVVVAVYAFTSRRAPGRLDRTSMVVPADNPVTDAKVALGRRLFYDRGLSFNNSLACASCHVQASAFADSRPRSLGASGEPLRRNTMTLTNVAYNLRLTWADSTIETLEQQALLPLTNEHPVEMGFNRNSGAILERLRSLPPYPELFKLAFTGEDNPVTLTNVAKALAAFERTLESVDSPYDRFAAGDTQALSDAAKRGETLFRSDALRCTECHGGFNFRFIKNYYVNRAETSIAYFNIGLYNVHNDGSYPADDRGLIEVTAAADDMGRFKAPTLRNIAVTAPYMHDGSVATLEEVIAILAAGGRNIQSGPDAGNGRANTHKSQFISGFAITPQQTRDLVSFLDSLTDREFLANPALSDPWTSSPTDEPGASIEDRLSSGGTAPRLIVIPKGELHADGQPVVSFTRRFAVASTETTVAQFRQFVAATGYQVPRECHYHTLDQVWTPKADASWSSPVIPQTDDHPVTCVMYEEAVAYADWLSAETGERYRLPTEAEFEFFNRAGHTSVYAFDVKQPSALCERTNGADQSSRMPYANACSDGYEATAPVGRFPPNDFGLYDTSGNLWELTTDCAVVQRSGLIAKLFGRGSGDPPCHAQHVVKGGSYLSSPTFLEASNREHERRRSNNVGFRVIREVH